MFEKTIEIIQRSNEKAGFLEAIKAVSRMATEADSPAESESFDRVFEKLVAEYDKRWKK